RLLRRRHGRNRSLSRRRLGLAADSGSDHKHGRPDEPTGKTSGCRIRSVEHSCLRALFFVGLHGFVNDFVSRLVPTITSTVYVGGGRGAACLAATWTGAPPAGANNAACITGGGFGD